jgi:hypothetical protein
MVNQDSAGAVPNYPPPTAPPVYQAEYDQVQQPIPVVAPLLHSSEDTPLIQEDTSTSFTLAADEFSSRKPLLSSDTPSTQQWDADK